MFYYYDDNKCLNRALIIHSGALGDCVLTLALAEFMRTVLGVNVVDFIGPGDYIGFMPGRTAVSRIKNINSLHLERLFEDPAALDIEDSDPLVAAFGGYNWIVSFLGESGSNFESNIAYIACFTSSPELVMLSARPPQDYKRHVSRYHIEELIEKKLPSIEAFGIESPHSFLDKDDFASSLICPNINDVQAGLSILAKRTSIKIAPSSKIAVISPGSGGLHKCWHIDNYIDLACRLRQMGASPVFLLGMAELERFTSQTISRLRQVTDVIDSLSIEQVVGLLSASHIYIGNDSGVSHISGAMGLATISVFGPTNPDVYKPAGSNTIAITPSPDSFVSLNRPSVDAVLEAAAAFMR